jgi:hypothetical protein
MSVERHLVLWSDACSVPERNRLLGAELVARAIGVRGAGLPHDDSLILGGSIGTVTYPNPTAQVIVPSGREDLGADADPYIVTAICVRSVSGDVTTDVRHVRTGAGGRYEQAMCAIDPEYNAAVLSRALLGLGVRVIAPDGVTFPWPND